MSSENKREICDRLDHGIIFTHTLTPGAIAADGSLLPSSSPFSSTIISQKLLPTNNERSEFPSSKTGHCWVEWGAPGQFLYLFGGGDEIKATHIDSWSVTTNMEELSANWSVVHTLAADVKIGRPSGRISPTCVKRGPNDMYVFGGRGDGKLFSNDLWRLHRHSADSSSSSKNTSSASSPPLNKNDKWVWTLMTDHNKLENYIPSARAGANMVVAGDFLVVWGGYNNYDTQYSPVQG